MHCVSHTGSDERPSPLTDAGSRDLPRGGGQARQWRRSTRPHGQSDRARSDGRQAEHSPTHTSAAGQAEGIVLRTPDRLVIGKARFQDYQRLYSISTHNALRTPGRRRIQPVRVCREGRCSSWPGASGYPMDEGVASIQCRVSQPRNRRAAPSSKVPSVPKAPPAWIRRSPAATGASRARMCSG